MEVCDYFLESYRSRPGITAVSIMSLERTTRKFRIASVAEAILPLIALQDVLNRMGHLMPLLRDPDWVVSFC